MAPSTASASPHNVPNAVKDWVFDIHDQVRRSQNADELKRLYAQFSELSSQYYSQEAWPAAEDIASECGVSHTQTP